MKKEVLFCLIFFMSGYLPSFANNYITGPSRVCPGQTVTFEWHVGFDVTNCAAIQWTVKQNGVEIGNFPSNSTNAYDWLTTTFQWPATETGPATIEVTGLVCCFLNLCDWNDYKDIQVGLDSENTTISGTNVVCPATSNLYTVTPIVDASTYTWEVPSGWQINGITGPVVTGQGNSAYITSNSGSVGVYTIKIKGVNSTSTCSSLDVDHYVEIDYPPIISIRGGDCSGGVTRFDAQSEGAVSYSWEIPSSWYLVSGQNTSTIRTYNYGNSGDAIVLIETVCGTYLSASYYLDLSACGSFLLSSNDNGLVIHPNPVSNELVLQTKDAPLSGVADMLNENGDVVGSQEIKEQKTTIDISRFKPGVYYLRYQQGKETVTKRFIKR